MSDPRHFDYPDNLDSRSTPPDAEAVARLRQEAIDLYWEACTSQSIAERRVDALIEAVERRVRAECAADTKRLDWLQREHGDTDTLPVAALVVKVGCARRSSNWANVVGDIRATIDRVMQEAQP